LAGLLYLGSGLGLLLFRTARRSAPVHLSAAEMGWLLAAIAAGGILAPVLLMWGLSGMPASGASLLLNAEGVFTALLAWFLFRENFDRRIAFGMVLIVAGAVVLSWPEDARSTEMLPALAVVAACFLWGLDNNLTRKVSLADATFIAMAKGLSAGVVNVALAWTLAPALPSAPIMFAALALGLVTYGVSLVLFVQALRHLGTARTGAYFSTAPFAGAALSIAVLGEPVTANLLVAGVLMGAGVWLHLTERHEHEHTHEPLEHEHEHVHDEHHRHEHDFPVASGERHAHPHRHESVTHTHSHFPDAHHRHTH
jgi:drug/metabolite transporter (DMT)-like permease